MSAAQTGTGGLVGAALLEKRMQDTFGMSDHEYNYSNAGRVPTGHLITAIRVVERSGLLTKIDEWRAAGRKSNAGAPPIIPLSALLVLFLLNVQMGHGVNYGELAKTLDVRLNKQQFDLLGILDTPGDRKDWYNRIWTAAGRLYALIDPYPAPKNRRLATDEYQVLLAEASTDEALATAKRKLEQLDLLCAQLVTTSVRMLPRDVWEKYEGNTIIDATKLQISGRPNSVDPLAKRRNLDPFSGRYRREGSHGGIGAKTDVPAYELETAVMAWNRPGENTLFPSLISAISFHRPGEMVGHGAYLVRKILEEHGFKHILVIVDRAYNGGAIENFHVPLRLMGCELVMDYKDKETGVQGHFENVILVDGNWYVQWMPKALIEVSDAMNVLKEQVDEAMSVIKKPAPQKPKKTGPVAAGEVHTAKALAAIYAPKTAEQNERLEKQALAREEIKVADAARVELLKLIENRERYRMIPKGRPDADGFQRFSYPDPARGLTGTAKKMGATAVKTITIPMLIPEGNSKATTSKKGQPLKYIQKFPWRTETWSGYYGMRSNVEASNNLLKLASAEDIGNPKKRSGRGFVAQYLAAALATVSSNVRRIVTFFRKEAELTATDTNRARRRKGLNGEALEHHNELLVAPLAAP